MTLPAQLDGLIWRHRWVGRLYPMHRHAELEVNLVVDGAAAYVMGDRRYDLVRGSMVWLFPQQDHLLLRQSPDYRMWVVVFKPDLIGRVCTSADTRTLRQANPIGHFCRRLDREQTTRLDGLLRGVAQAEPDAPRFNAGLAYALLSAWAAYRAADDTGQGHDLHPSVERAARLLHEMAAPMGVEALARQVGLSPSHLSHLFKAQMGVTLVDFRNRQCLERFVRLYGQGRRRSMMDAALDAGFGSYAQFYRVFVRFMGCTPGAYRRRRGRLDDDGDLADHNDVSPS